VAVDPRAFRNQVHEQALDVAQRTLVEVGWDKLRFGEVATAVGVSRPTLYAAFGSKEGLAEALVLRETDRFLTGVEQAIGEHSDLRAQWAAAVRYTLDTAGSDPLLKEVLTSDSAAEFLPLVTTGSAPIIEAARARLCAAFVASHPDLDQRELDFVAESVTRLALSHIVQPTEPAEVVAGQVAELAARFLEAKH